MFDVSKLMYEVLLIACLAESLEIKPEIMQKMKESLAKRKA